MIRLNIMNRYAKYLILLLMLLVDTTAWAQLRNFAGRDTAVLRKFNNVQTVWLGVADDEYCYDWDVLPEKIFSSDIHAGKILYNPTLPEERILVSRVTLNGVEEDQVIVKVLDSVIIKSVKFKKQCYEHGDNIDIKDFEIETYPAGYEKDVFLRTYRASNLFGMVEDLQPVIFGIIKNGKVDYDTTYVTVYNSNLGYDHALTINPKALLNFRQVLFNAKVAWNNLETVKDKLKRFKGISMLGRPPKAEFSADFALPIPKPYARCCDGIGKHGGKIDFVNLEGMADFEAYFKLAGVPHVAELDAFFGFGGTISFSSLGLILSDEDICDPNHLDLCVGVEVRGGLDGYVLDPSILDIRAFVFGNINGCFDGVAIIKGTSIATLSMNLGFKLSATFLDFASWESSYALWSTTETIGNK